MKTIVISVEEFTEILEDRLKNFFSSSTPEKEVSKEEEILTRHDLAKLFGVSLVTINEWCRKGILTPHHMNSRVYFKKSEVMKALTSSKLGRRGR